MSSGLPGAQAGGRDAPGSSSGDEPGSPYGPGHTGRLREGGPSGPSHGADPPGLGIAGARYGIYVVVLAAILLIVFTLHVALSSHKGATSIKPGARIPPFAAPYALGGPPGEVDVATHANDGPAGKIAACSERGPAILNICQLYERGPVVLALFFDAGSCAGVLDELQRLTGEFPQVGFAAVAIKENAGAVAKIVRSKRLTLPVGVDTDGRLGERYAMVSCPQITFVYPGGVVQSAALISHPAPGTLRARIARLLAASRARGWKPAGA